MKRSHERVGTTVMSPEAWLEKIGTTYLSQIELDEPQFLIETDVVDERLQELFQNISKAWPSRWTPAKRICLALAAVHAAARADENESSFREAFYRRLGRQFNQKEWECLRPCRGKLSEGVVCSRTAERWSLLLRRGGLSARWNTGTRALPVLPSVGSSAPGQPRIYTDRVRRSSRKVDLVSRSSIP